MPGIAHQMGLDRQPHAPNKLDTNKELNKYVLDGLNNGWSLEQILGRTKIEKKEFSTCPESIYRDKKNLYTNCFQEKIQMSRTKQGRKAKNNTNGQT